MLLPKNVKSSPLVRAFDAALVVRGPGGTTKRHAHHWWHLVLGLDAPLRASGPDGADREAPAVLTPPDLPHAIEAQGNVAIVYIEPESRVGASLAAACPARRLHVLSEPEAERLRLELGGSQGPVESALAMLLEVLEARAVPSAPKHPAVLRVLRHLENAAPDEDVSLESLAEVAGLSPGRLMHAFTEYVGLPIRPYVRWLRLRRAAASLLGGASAAEAAHGAGFSDAAHMTRTFREMFGVTPSELSRRSQVSG